MGGKGVTAMDKEQYLKMQLSDLQKSYQDAAKPLIDELVKIASMKVSAPIIPIDQLVALGVKRYEPKE